MKYKKQYEKAIRKTDVETRELTSWPRKSRRILVRKKGDIALETLRPSGGASLSMHSPPVAGEEAPCESGTGKGAIACNPSRN